MQGKAVIITGSSRGIGKATAIHFCQEGSSVLLNGRNESKLEETYEELSNAGFNVERCAGDITSEEECQKIIDTALASFGKIDVLINNGSASMEDRFEDLAPKTFHDVLVSNSYGSALPSLLALPHLKKTKGSIVFISSLAGYLGVPKASAYSAGKMALTGLAQSLRAELHSTGIHIGVVHVSFTQNDDDKMVLNHDGSMKKVADRPPGLQQTQAKVASSIYKLVKRRKKRITLAFAGKFFGFLMRNFPGLVVKMMINKDKKTAKKRLKPQANVNRRRLSKD